MAWIEVHQALFTHRKTFALADLLGLAEVYAVGHLVALWSWAIDNAQDGIIVASPRTIGKAAQWPGDVTTFVSALVETGFLDRKGEDLSIHDWDDYAGKLIDQRHANADRQRRHRERVKAVMNVTPTAPITGTSPLRNPATVPNPTQPNPTQPDRTGPAEEGALTRDGADAPASPEPPVPSKAISVPKRAALEQPTPEGYALLGAVCELLHASVRGDRRRREGLLADELLQRCEGDAAEAMAYVQWRLDRGDSPQLQWAARDYAPGWRQKANGLRASPNGRGGGLSVQQLLRGEG